MARTPMLRPLLVLALAAPASAQGVLFPAGAKLVLDSLAAAPGAASGRGLAGDVTGDLLPDAVWIRDGEPFVVYGPAAYRSSFAVPLAATDIELLPAPAPGRAQPLVVVNAGGLWQLSGYDGGFPPAVRLAAGPWAGATRVRAGDVDGDGCVDLIGLSAAGELVVLARCAPSPAAIPQVAPVLDFVALDWDGTPGDELAVLRTDGFHVFSGAGALLYSASGSVEGGFVARIRENGLGRERCAVLYTAGSQFLVVLDAAHAEAALDLGPAADFFGGTAADADGDGADDLCLLSRAAHQAVLLLDHGASSTASFTPAAAQLVPLADAEPPPATWSAWPVLHDFSLDGDPDLLAYVEGTDELAFFEDAALPLVRDQVVIDSGAYLFHKDTKTGELVLLASVPETSSFPATHVRVTLWREPEGQPLESEAVGDELFAIDGGNDKATLQLSFPEQDLYTTNLYHLDVRSVRVEGAERTLVASGPPAVHAFTTPEFLTSQLEDQFGKGTPLRTFLLGAPGAKATVKTFLDPLELLERALAPKDVKTLRIPKTAGPPDPF